MTAWDAEQLSNARLIIAVGLEMGMSQRDIQIGLMTAMQESSLRNVRSDNGVGAFGLFQQRPVSGWGSYSQVTNPLYAAKKFFTVLSGVKGRNSMSLWGAAEKVQRSGLPGAYAKWESDALRILGQSGEKVPLPFPVNKPYSGLEMDGYLAGQNATTDPEHGMPAVQSVQSDKIAPAGGGSGASTSDVSVPAQPGPPMEDFDLQGKMDKAFPELGAHVAGIRGRLIDAAKQSLGTPYVWGGAAPGGFDCSGLIYYWYNKLGVKVPRVSQDQVNIGARVPVQDLDPGDFVGFGDDAHHIAIYLGNGQILEAPHTGAQVRIRQLGKGEGWGVHLSLPGEQPSARGVIITPPKEDENLPPGVAAGTPAGPIINFPGLNFG